MHDGDQITQINNPLTASRMGEVRERQIRTARGTLNALVKTHGKCLDDESLHALLVEVEAIVSSRPMTTDTISNVKSDNLILSRANLLTIKSKVILPPPGCFSSADTVEMAQRVSVNIARTKNLQKLKKKLSKRRLCTVESQNSSKPLILNAHS